MEQDFNDTAYGIDSNTYGIDSLPCFCYFSTLKHFGLVLMLRYWFDMILDLFSLMKNMLKLISNVCVCLRDNSKLFLTKTSYYLI